MLKDPEQYRAYMRAYMGKRYAERRDEALRLLGGKCVACGEREVDRLQVDHVDRSLKQMSFERMAFVSRSRFLEELSKCQLLCDTCHVKKTIEERGHNSRKQHGTYVSYRYGCRCNDCKAACAEHTRNYRAKYGRR